MTRCPPKPAARVVRSLLSADDLCRIVSATHSLSAEATCQLLAVGDNDNYLLQDKDRSYLLRVYALGKPWPCRESDCRFELDLLLYLHRDGLPVAPPLPRHDGDILTMVDAPEGARPLALFAYMPGQEDPFPQAADRLRGIGTTLARLHRSLNGFRSDAERYAIDRDFLLEQPLARATRHLRSRGRNGDADHLEQVAARIRPHLAAIPATEDTVGAINGDFHGHNYHFAADGGIILFDFDLSGIGWRAYDLAVWLWYARKRMRDAETFRLWRVLMDGYQSLRPLLPAEQSALPWLVMAREIWLMGAHVGDIPVLGVARLTDEYWVSGLRRLRKWCREQETAAGRALFGLLPIQTVRR